MDDDATFEWGLDNGRGDAVRGIDGCLDVARRTAAGLGERAPREERRVADAADTLAVVGGAGRDTGDVGAVAVGEALQRD